MKQDGWTQQGPQEAQQTRGQQQRSRPAPGKVTRTSRLSAGQAPAVQRTLAAPDAVPRPQGPLASGTERHAFMDMAHRGLTAVQDSSAPDGQVQAASHDQIGVHAVVGRAADADRSAPIQRKQSRVVQAQEDPDAAAAQSQTGTSGHPVPMDVFLRVMVETRLMRLSAQPQVSTGNLSEPQAPVAQDTAGSPALIPTTVVLRERTIVRAAIPGGAPAQVPGHRFICNAAELFGWVPTTSLTELDAAPEPVEGAEGLDEETPDDDMPALSVSEYDNLVILDADAVVYRRASEESNPVTVAHRMETVVYVGAPVTAESKRWQQIRMVREPRESGWIQDSGTNTGIESAMSGGTVSLRYGVTNPAVREVEQLLANLGKTTGPVDDYFDEVTERAVIEFQTERGLEIDGVVGPQTMAALRRAVPGDGLSWENRSTGPLVLEVEQMLDSLGYDLVKIDEVFDRETNTAVERFQADHGLDDDGLVGPLTMAALRNAVAPQMAELQAGTWVGGYTLINRTTGRAMTPDGQMSSAGFTSAVQGMGSMMNGPCEVLHQGGSPASIEADGNQWWYVRGVNGGAGWTPMTNVRSEAAAGDEAAPATEVGMAEELAQLCPNGITVCFVTQFNDAGRSFSTFLSEGAAFATTHNAVAISGGQLVTGTVNLITHKNQIVAILAQIQQALRAGAATVPPWARVAHLAFFTHGSHIEGPEYGGLQTDADDWYQDGNLRAADLAGFARTLTAFCTSDVEVSLFACSTGMENPIGTGHASSYFNYMGWLQQPGLTGGEGSFADIMSDELVDAGASDAMVMGHTTIGHTVRNPAARLYTGSDDGGVNVFNWVFLPLEDWLATELADIDRSDIAENSTDFLEFQLFSWFRDEMIIPSSSLSARMSTDPELFKVEIREAARDWVHERYFTWGVVTEEMFASRRAILNPQSGARTPIYKWAERPASMVEIAPGTTIEILPRPIEVVQGVECYAITWADDPYPPESASPVQAYLPVGWVVYVYGDQ